MRDADAAMPAPSDAAAAAPMLFLMRAMARTLLFYADAPLTAFVIATPRALTRCLRRCARHAAIFAER